MEIQDCSLLVVTNHVTTISLISLSVASFLFLSSLCILSFLFLSSIYLVPSFFFICRFLCRLRRLWTGSPITIFLLSSSRKMKSGLFILKRTRLNLDNFIIRRGVHSSEYKAVSGEEKILSLLKDAALKSIAFCYPCTSACIRVYISRPLCSIVHSGRKDTHVL